MDRRVPAIVALLVAASLVAAPTVLFPHAGQPEYYHSVERIDAGQVPDGVTVRRYENLSPAGKRAFDAALDAPDGSAVVYGAANRPPEFFYSDYADYGQGIYVIEKEGRYYRLETFAGGGFFPVDLLAAAALALVGGAVAVVGVAGLRRGRLREPAVAAVGGLAVLAAVAAADAALGTRVLLVALGAVPVAWAAVGATHAARTALGGAAVVGSVLLVATWATRTGGPVAIAAGMAVLLVLSTGLGVAGRWARRRIASGGLRGSSGG
ncbi:MAG: hypothetical protein ABEJ81_08360 [Haloferacaceae archaeon]